MTLDRIGQFKSWAERWKILNLISSIQDSTAGREDALGHSSVVHSPPIPVDTLPASLANRVSTVGAEALQKCCVGLSENGIDAVSHELKLLKDAINDQNTFSFIKDKTVNIEERNDKLRQYLFSALVVRHSGRPFLNESNIDNLITAINGAHLVDDGTDCRSSLKFGTACFKSNVDFLGMLFHELEHNTNQSSPQVDEGRCDWASFKMLKRIAGTDRELFDRLYREYSRATFYEQESDLAYNKLPGLSGDSHTTARAFSQSLIKAMESRGCELYDFVDMIYNSWADASEIENPGQ